METFKDRAVLNPGVDNKGAVHKSKVPVKIQNRRALRPATVSNCYKINHFTLSSPWRRRAKPVIVNTDPLHAPQP
jgi:hypothetical protein